MQGRRPRRKNGSDFPQAKTVVSEDPTQAEQTSPCPFCEVADVDCIHVSSSVRAFWDAHPVSPGHALIASRRHIPDWFSATAQEQIDVMAAIAKVRETIEKTHNPQGYNLGLNIGVAAGQTVSHLHLHVIPRYTGDVPDPRGGVRFVIPEKAGYLTGMPIDGLPHARALIEGAEHDPLLPHLIAHLANADRVDIAVAFAMTSGVRLLAEHLRDVIARGGRVRLLTGDYLYATEPEALRRLLDLGPALELRIYVTGGTSFHLKSYICARQSGVGTAFVGSSNMSHTALQTGLEWNYRLVASRDGAGYANVTEAFDRVFTHSRTVAVDKETSVPVPVPHPVQEEALAALRATRTKGEGAGLVVLATGLGKTWLAAFDSEQSGASRVLFVAHREEILDQAMRTFRTIRPGAVLGKYTGTEKHVGADCTFASIQTLGRKAHLNRFSADYFDYIVVDEFHHASAASYRKLLEHFTPTFLLGLTATPDRTDGADLLALCGENLVYRCDLAEGIRRGLLSPFDYYGVPDEVDYEQIPWRSARFDEEALSTAVATTSRADNALEQLGRRGGSKTLAFCVSMRHAEFMKRHFKDAGKRVAAVHSGPTSDPRTKSLEALQAGELDVLFAVDMFNEGVDLPDVDTILMLRPTESSILWLQQFGRGLRRREGKRLKVIDYIGNHRLFLTKPRTLFQLEDGDANLSYALKLIDEGRESELLPPGCSVTYELEAKDILRQLLTRTGEPLLAFYADFRARNGVRPTATEVFHAYLDPKAARRSHGSWFQLVSVMEDLSPNQARAEERVRGFLGMLETTRMTRSFKMVFLLAMIAEGAFPRSVPVAQLVSRVRTIVKRSATLREEFGDAIGSDAALLDFLRTQLVASWVDSRDGTAERYFAFEDDQFKCLLDVPSDLELSATELVRELVEWRLAVYLQRTRQMSGADRIVCRVSHSNGRPLLFLPKGERVDSLPEGWVDVNVEGDSYQAKFAKIAVNVMHRSGEEENVLPDLLRQWFGPSAGQPGTTQQVEFVRTGGVYVLAPTDGELREGPKLWSEYKRADVPKLFDFAFRGRESQVGIVERERLMLLFVTLEKGQQPAEHRYKDEFLRPDELQWQTQNRTRRESAVAEHIRKHAELGIAVHLFVRAVASVRGQTQLFTYCGQLEYLREEGEKPVTVWWRLAAPVPARLHRVLRVPETVE
jgi:superfamily II DNA or RNA helicase/diadenosine tetraphosphate (Ap4A) HIT family hydrolase